MTIKSLIFAALLFSNLAHAAERTVVIGAVGDIMMGSDYPDSRLPAHPENLFADAQGILQGVDIAFGNFEGTFGIGGTSTKGGANSYSFRTPPEFVDYLAEAGFDVMSLANNHAMDFGPKGIAQTKAALDSENIDWSSRDDGIARFTVNGLKVVFIAATIKGKRNINEPAALIAEIKTESAANDIVVVSVHAGKEGNGASRTLNQTEEAYGENRGNVVKFGRAAVDAGADLHLMHGPHVPRAMEVYKERLIAYSLGNFCTYGRFGLSGDSGLAPLLEVKLDETGRLLEGQIHSFIQKAPGGPVADSKNRAAQRIAELSKQDMPSSAPLFAADGYFAPAGDVQIPSLQ